MQIRFAVLILLSGLTMRLHAQTQDRMEVGVQFTALQLAPLEEKPAGVGGRASYDFALKSLTLAPEVEFNYFPQNPSGNFGESQLLLGMKAGVKMDSVGAFLKVRPGFVHIGGDDFKARNGGASTNFALDVGGVFEYYTSRNIIIRLDFGDTMVHFPDPVVTPSINPIKPAGLYHNFQGGIGIGFRF